MNDSPRARDSLAEAWLGQWVSAWVATCVRHSAWVIGLAVVLAGALVPPLMTRLGVNSDTTDMISDRVAWRQHYNDYRKAFPGFDDLLVVVIDAPTPIRAMDAADRLADALDGHPHLASVFQPEGGEFLDRHGLLYLEPEALAARVDQVAAMQPFLANAADAAGLLGVASQIDIDSAAPQTRRVAEAIWQSVQAAAEGRRVPVPWSGLESSAGDSRRVLLLQARQDFAAWRPGQSAMEAVRRGAADLALSEDGIQVRLTGPVALQTEELDSVGRGVVQGVSLALVMVALVLYLALRSIRLVIITVVVLLVGLIMTAGFAAFTVGRLNLISVAFAVLYIGLGIDFSIHFCLRFRELLAENPSVDRAIGEAARDVGASLLLCALTTSLGFLAFYPTRFKGVAELGLISGAGMLISVIVTLSLLPALLSRLPRAQTLDLRPAGMLADPVGRFIQRRASWILAGAIGLGGVAVVLAFQSRFDSNPVNLRDPVSESVQAYRDLLADSGRTPMTLSLLVHESEAAAQVQRLEALPEVAEVRWLADLIPGQQAEKLVLLDELALVIGGLSMVPAVDGEGLKAATEALAVAWQGPSGISNDIEHWAPLATDLTWELQQILDRLHRGLEAGSFDIQDLPSHWLAHWRSQDGRMRLEILPGPTLSRVESAGEFVAAVHQIHPAATGLPVINVYGGRVVVGAFQQAFASAALAVALLLLVLLRRIGDVLVVLVPLALATAMTAAATVLLELPFNYANIITLPLLLGMGVDNGIHLVHRARHAPPQDGNLLASSTVRAVVFSALTTIVSFGNLAFLPHPGTASMGQLLAVGMLINGLCTLVVLPALISRLRWTAG